VVRIRGGEPDISVRNLSPRYSTQKLHDSRVVTHTREVVESPLVADTADLRLRLAKKEKSLRFGFVHAGYIFHDLLLFSFEGLSSPGSQFFCGMEPIFLR
jgi:hypothetical protein